MIINRITDAQLTKAAALVRGSMLSSIPNPEECDHTFSSEFDRKMEAMRRREERRKQRRQTTRRVAAAIVTVFVGLSVFCAMNTEVRAAIRGWTKELVGDSAYYWFQGEKADELPYYELTYVPEGYKVVQEDKFSNSHTVVYQKGNDAHDCFVVDYNLIHSDSQITMGYDGVIHEVKEITVNGCRGELHISTDVSKECHCLLWVDENNGVWFAISAFLDTEEIIAMAESLQLAAE